MTSSARPLRRTIAHGSEPKKTLVVPVKLAPVSVTQSPSKPTRGRNEVTNGGSRTVKRKRLGWGARGGGAARASRGGAAGGGGARRGGGSRGGGGRGGGRGAGRGGAPGGPGGGGGGGRRGGTGGGRGRGSCGGRAADRRSPF